MVVTHAAGIDDDIGHHGKYDDTIVSGLDHPKGIPELRHVPDYSTVTCLRIGAAGTIKISSHIGIAEYQQILSVHLLRHFENEKGKLASLPFIAALLMTVDVAGSPSSAWLDLTKVYY